MERRSKRAVKIGGAVAMVSVILVVIRVGFVFGVNRGE